MDTKYYLTGNFYITPNMDDGKFVASVERKGKLIECEVNCDNDQFFTAISQLSYIIDESNSVHKIITLDREDVVTMFSCGEKCYYFHFKEKDIENCESDMGIRLKNKLKELEDNEINGVMIQITTKNTDFEIGGSIMMDNLSYALQDLYEDIDIVTSFGNNPAISDEEEYWLDFWCIC